MILYIENPKDTKLLELINEYSKVAGYRINTHKSLAFIYTNNEKTEREIKEIIPFTIATKIIKYLLRLQSFPASGSFPMSQLFASGGQSIGVSALASVL